MAEKKQGVFPMFNVIALSDAKSKKKVAGLDDLLNCVKNLASSTESLRDYGNVADGDNKSKIELYLNGLLKIQDGLLEIARENIARTGTMQVVETPGTEKIGPAVE